MKIFIVNGQGGCGKTTFEEAVASYARNYPNNKIVGITSIIAPIKDVAKTFGYREDRKDEKDRKFLFELKKLLGEYNDYPYSQMKLWILYYVYIGAEALFIDAREKEDIERLVNDYDAQTILIVRGPQKEYGNEADDKVFKDKVNYDYIINNDGSLSWLRDKAYKFYDEVIKGD